MNRIIKFRAWDKISQKMRDWDYIQLNCSFGWLFESYAVAMQFTGLKDKNDKDVYEGDLLKISMQGDIQVQPFLVENMWDLRIELQNKDSYMRIDDDFEIIGNVYSNPELLETAHDRDAKATDY